MVLFPGGFAPGLRLLFCATSPPEGKPPAWTLPEVMLAGLARDGGLYLPEAWPTLDRTTIAGFAGRPYAEVALDVIRPFTGDFDRRGRSRPHGARGLRHLSPSRRGAVSQLGTNTFALELFHGPTLAFKDVAMQLLARLMDHALAARGERRTIVVATSGDTGGAAVEAFGDRNQVDLIVLFPNGRVSDVQQRMMTTANAANIHALAIDGTFDDCQAIVKGMFNHAAFRDRVASPASTRSTGRGSWRRRSITSPPRCRSARRTAGSRSRCRPGISATFMPAMWRSAWACRSTGS